MMETLLDRYGVQFRPDYHGWQSVSCLNPTGHVHGDRNPSARVNLTLDGYACHGCGLKGDSYKVLMDLESMTFKEAKAVLGGDDTPESEPTWITWR